MLREVPAVPDQPLNPRVAEGTAARGWLGALLAARPSEAVPCSCWALGTGLRAPSSSGLRGSVPDLGPELTYAAQLSSTASRTFPALTSRPQGHVQHRLHDGPSPVRTRAAGSAPAHVEAYACPREIWESRACPNCLLNA